MQSCFTMKKIFPRQPTLSEMKARVTIPLMISLGLFLFVLALPGMTYTKENFTFDQVVAKAQQLVQKPYNPEKGLIPNFLMNISYDAWRDIRFKPPKSLWKDENLPFNVTIGTENVSGITCDSAQKSEVRSLNTICNRVMKLNKTKSFIIDKYFKNMRFVFEECYKVLKRGGHFCLITGNNTICGVRVPSHRICSDMGKAVGFRIAEMGRDKIRDRALPPSRNHDGGVIKKEWIIVFEKGCG